MCQRMSGTRAQAVAKGGEASGREYDKVSAMNPQQRTTYTMGKFAKIMKSPNLRRLR
jgi:hypothetical protein